ncbi:MAG: MerR family transcriptional regulator [Cardiobacteriaceae bacterium]|nr:MerR family transcriptional regulator [Cardiobacteriaceae bacterium]
MKIGEFAKACNISVRMLRFYEELQLISPTRSDRGFRIYREDDVAIVRKIILLSQAGLALKDIALLRDCLYGHPQQFCNALREKLRERQSDIDRQIDVLAQSKTLLNTLLAGEVIQPWTPQ